MSNLKKKKCCNPLAYTECYIRIAGNSLQFWLVGSSIIKHAFLEARKNPSGVNLGLERHGIRLWWQGRSGLVLMKLKGQIRLMMKFEDPPNFILIHIGGNDLGNIKLGVLRNRLKNFMVWLKDMMPEVTIIWSQILPRTNWRYSKNVEAMDKARARLNSSIASFVLRMGGGYLRYPDIKGNPTFLKDDGVHLTDLGNNIFNNTIQGGFEEFVLHGVGTYPNQCII